MHSLNVLFIISLHKYKIMAILFIYKLLIIFHHPNDDRTITTVMFTIV